MILFNWLIKQISYNWSYFLYFLFFKLVHIIFGYDNLFLIFSSLSFNSRSFNSMKYFLPLKIDYLAYFFKYFSLNIFILKAWVSIAIYSETFFWKIYESKNIVFKWFFRVMSSYFVTQTFRSYIFQTIFEKLMKTKILYLIDFFE